MTEHLDGLGLAAFNALPDDRARTVLKDCCTSATWVDAILAGRPYAEPSDVLAAADTALAAMTEEDVDEALAGHPRIGERAAAGHSAWSSGEQSGVSSAEDRTRTALAEGNRAYEERFGHVYLVCATGRSADDLLAVLHERLDNDLATERRVVRDELGKINRIRLERLLLPKRGREHP